MAGYIKLFRKFADWEWYSNIKVTRVFIHLLLCASYEDNEWKKHKLKQGQLITGRKRLAFETGLTEAEVRTVLSNLQSTNELTIKSTKQYSIITINNWKQYQQNNQQNALQLTTTKEDKKKRNIKTLGEFKNVFLTGDEIEKVKTNFGDKFDDAIEKLSSYIATKSKDPYKSHYAVLSKGNWIYKELSQKGKMVKGNFTPKEQGAYNAFA